MTTPERPAFVDCEGSGKPGPKRKASIIAMKNGTPVLVAREYACPVCGFTWTVTHGTEPATFTVRNHQRQERSAQ